jgi:hypothetical protein
VLIVEFLDSDGEIATGGARVVARLRRGSQLETFYAQRLDVEFNAGNPLETQAILIGMLRGPVLGAFFEDVCSGDGSLCPDPEDCGDDGSLCPECGEDGSLCTPVGVVLKRLEEFGPPVDDLAYRTPPPYDISSVYMVTDVVMSTTEPL